MSKKKQNKDIPILPEYVAEHMNRFDGLHYVMEQHPIPENKYNLTISILRNEYKVGSTELLHELGWRNNVVKAWCISREVGPNIDEDWFWIGFYDAGTFEIKFTSYGGMCGYDFDDFMNPEDIENYMDYEIQYYFWTKIMELIDKGVLVKK